jgi:hypothetical protein
MYLYLSFNANHERDTTSVVENRSHFQLFDPWVDYRGQSTVSLLIDYCLDIRYKKSEKILASDPIQELPWQTLLSDQENVGMGKHHSTTYHNWAES